MKVGGVKQRGADALEVSWTVTPDSSSSSPSSSPGGDEGGLADGQRRRPGERAVVRAVATPIASHTMEAGNDNAGLSGGEGSLDKKHGVGNDEDGGNLRGGLDGPSVAMAEAVLLPKSCSANNDNSKEDGVVSCSIEGLLPDVDYRVSLQTVRVTDDDDDDDGDDEVDDEKDLEVLSSLDVPGGPFRVKGPTVTPQPDVSHVDKGMHRMKRLSHST